MVWTRLLSALALAFTLALAAATACSSTPVSVTPGHCTLNDGVWSCGDGFSELAQCPGHPSATQGSPCDFDAGPSCFDCAGSSGDTCQCFVADAGAGKTWHCYAAQGTTCSP